MMMCLQDKCRDIKAEKNSSEFIHHAHAAPRRQRSRTERGERRSRHRFYIGRSDA